MQTSTLYYSGGKEKPTSQVAAPHSETSKDYWTQWDSLQLQEGELYRLWCYDAASNCDQLDVEDPVWLHCPQQKE